MSDEWSVPFRDYTYFEDTSVVSVMKAQKMLKYVESSIIGSESVIGYPWIFFNAAQGQDTSEENSRVNSPPTGKGSAHKCDVRDNTLRSNEILGQPPLPRLPLANVKHSVPGKGQSARQNSNMWAEHLCGRSLPLSGENLLDYFPLMYLGL